MTLSAHDRKVLAAIEHDLSGQDPELSDLFATAGPGGRRQQRLPVSLRHIGWLVGALLTLIVAHVTAGEVNPLASAGLTGALILTWVVVAAARVSRDTQPGPGPMSRRRSKSNDSSTGSRATPRDDERDGSDDDGCCPA